MEKLTVGEYAKLKKISIQAVYKQIREGKLLIEKMSNKTFVLIENMEELQEPQEQAEKETNKKIEADSSELLKQELAHIREINESLTNDKKQLQEQLGGISERLKESNVLLLREQQNVASLTESVGRQAEHIKQLQAPKGFFAKIKGLLGG